MSGTINLALTQQLDEYGQPLSGGQLYLIQAGTVSTPQNGFQDTALTIPLPNPITLDAAGRIPQFFLADGQIKVRLQDKAGVIKFVADNLLVIGPSAGGGGGGGSVDPTTVWQTGDLKARYDTAIIPGFVRANGKTIGSSSSGATELADPSAQALFLHLWNKDATLPVTPSRGASASADWTANKQIATPDWRGCTIAALDDMGNSPAGRLTTSYFGVAATALGAFSGNESNTLNANQMPTHLHAATISDPGHAHTAPNRALVTLAAQGSGLGGIWSGDTTVPTSNVGTGVYLQDGFGNRNQTQSAGGGQAHANCQPTKLCTVYLKL